MLEKEIAFWERQKHIKLNEVQKQAVINSEGALLLLATPGSGKTTTTIMKIGYLIEVKGVKAEEIKAVTFSRVAAIEMKNRFKRFFPNLDSVDFSTIHSLAFKIVVEYFKSNSGDRLAVTITDEGIEVPGNTGPKGLRNIAVGATPPANPQNNDLWIDTTGGGTP